MQENRPSATAMRVAISRAAHQLLDRPVVFEDPLALRIIGEDAKAELLANPSARQRPILCSMRALLVARSRYAEEALAAAIARGVRQYVVLGAGLDTFAYRNPHRALRVFEVDHPATQAWKRTRLAEARIAVAPSLTFAPVDFEKETLADGLARAGLDPALPTFFSWLGVTCYLTREAVMDTLGFVARRGAGTEIVFDFAVPPERLDHETRRSFEMVSAFVAALGEPFITLLDPAPLKRELGTMGFGHVEIVTASTINARYFDDRNDGLYMEDASHLLHASV